MRLILKEYNYLDGTSIHSVKNLKCTLEKILYRGNKLQVCCNKILMVVLFCELPIKVG